MHASSHEMMGIFVETHLHAHRDDPLDIVDFGAQMIGAEQLTYRTHLAEEAWNYRGIDIVEGRNVDVVLADPYRWTELPSESVDLFVSGQAFEHIEHFWVTIFEVVRVLKPGGITAIVAPSSGYEHRFPVDCWRFYPDGFAALARYAQCEVVEAFADWGNGDWGDAILVLRKPVWSDDERARFDRRAGMQRLMLSEQPITAARIADEWQYQPQGGGATSVLADVRAGMLSERLADRRDRRNGEAAERAAHAEAERAHHLAALETRVAALDEHNRQLQTALEAVEHVTRGGSESTVARYYGQVRARIADAAGDSGRAWYKRLRNRP